jgi:hypothetical protein
MIGEQVAHMTHSMSPPHKLQAPSTAEHHWGMEQRQAKYAEGTTRRKNKGNSRQLEQQT